MKKNATFILLITFSTLFFSCNNKNNANTKVDDLTVDKRRLEFSTKKISDAIIGLWRLRKVEYGDGSSSSQFEDRYIEFFKDNRFEESRNGKGLWFLSFGIMDSNSVVNISFVRSGYGTESNPKFEASSCTLKFDNSNNVNYLVIFDLESRDKKYYVRQQ